MNDVRRACRIIEGKNAHILPHSLQSYARNTFICKEGRGGECEPKKKRRQPKWAMSLKMDEA